ncbi:MAG TPA: hypothetical protein VFK06_23415 [Candidatus Angelobacter sp.]|nr:hypothetical protein [Candidatus Angelobacter sp.]
MSAKLAWITMGVGLKICWVAITSFACIYVLSQVMQAIRWLRSRQPEYVPSFQRAIIWLALAAVVTVQYYYIAYLHTDGKLTSSMLFSGEASNVELGVSNDVFPETQPREEVRKFYSLSPRVSEKLASVVIQLRPATLTVEQQNIFTIKAVGDIEPYCYLITGEIKELGFKREFTRQEILRGIKLTINPRKTGTFRLRFGCREHEISSVPLTVVLPGSTLENSQLTWILDAGKAIYGSNGFELPVFIRSVENHGKTEVPHSLSASAIFSVSDQKGNLMHPIELVIPANGAISTPVAIPFSAHSDYSLVAFQKASGRQSNSLKVNWTTHGPKLDLSIYPRTLEVYAAPISTRSAELYIESDGQRISPSETIDILLQAPLGVISDPKDKLSISASNPVATYRVSGGGGGGVVKAAFREPLLGIDKALEIKVLSIRLFLLLAFCTGLVGVACGRGVSLFTERGVRLFISLVTASVAGWLLYLLLIMRWIQPPNMDESIVDYVPAAFIGIVGGYIGLGTFKVAASLFQLSAKVLSKRADSLSAQEQ